MENEATDIWRGDQHIKIIGLKDPGNATRKIGESKIEEMKWFVNGCLYDDADCFSILACHRANLYPFFKDLNTNLMLSGHLHGGIVRLPGLGGIVGENMELHLSLIHIWPYLLTVSKLFRTLKDTVYSKGVQGVEGNAQK